MLWYCGNVRVVTKILSCRFAFEKINSHTCKLEELAKALRDTEERPSGFIKGAIVFDG